MLPEGETIENFVDQLEFRPLRVVKIDYQPSLINLFGYLSSTKMKPDLILELEWRGERQQFIAEWKRRSTPSDLEGAIQQLQRYREALTHVQPGCEPALMVIIPYLNPEALERLSAEDISGIDLSGNGVVTIPGKWFVYRMGAENRFPSSALIKNVFRGTSSLVPRLFLVRRTFSSVSEVREEIERRGGSITLSTVSKVLKTLQDELIIGRGETIKLLDAGRLLDQLSKNHREPRVRRRLKIKVPSFPSSMEALSKFKSNAEREGLLVVGNLPSRYVVMPSAEAMKIYTTSIDKLLRDVEFTETSRFPDFELMQTMEKTVYFDRREQDGFYWVSPVQVYLELAAGGKREQETAAQLRDDLLKPRFGDWGDRD